jgi:hypothetical protein
MILTPPISEWCKTTTRGAEDVIEAVVLPDGEAIVPDDRLKVVGMATVGVLVVVDVKEVSIKSDPVTFASVGAAVTRGPAIVPERDAPGSVTAATSRLDIAVARTALVCERGVRGTASAVEGDVCRAYILGGTILRPAAFDIELRIGVTKTVEIGVACLGDTTRGARRKGGHR